MKSTLLWVTFLAVMSCVRKNSIRYVEFNGNSSMPSSVTKKEIRIQAMTCATTWSSPGNRSRCLSKSTVLEDGALCDTQRFSLSLSRLKIQQRLRLNSVQWMARGGSGDLHSERSRCFSCMATIKLSKLCGNVDDCDRRGCCKTIQFYLKPDVKPAFPRR